MKNSNEPDAEKRGRVAKLVRANPKASDRAIARRAKCTHGLVALVRAQVKPGSVAPGRVYRPGYTLTQAGSVRDRGPEPAVAELLALLESCGAPALLQLAVALTKLAQAKIAPN